MHSMVLDVSIVVKKFNLFYAQIVIVTFQQCLNFGSQIQNSPASI